jgi:iron complex outermembrane receptor protein
MARLQRQSIDRAMLSIAGVTKNCIAPQSDASKVTNLVHNRHHSDIKKRPHRRSRIRENEMSKACLYAMTALSTAVALSVSAPALAQDKPEAGSDAAAGGDIIVTARRSEERLQDVPISITVLNQQQLDQRNIVSTADLGNFVPSLSVNQQFGPEKASFVIRGFQQAYHTAPTVGVYFADVIAPRALGPTTSGNGAGIGSMFDLENIQVLKGPQGTLFGRNTTGGAILLVPTKPKDTFGGWVEGSLGDYNMHRIQAVVNVPLSDTFRIRAGVDWNQRDGYLKNVTDIGPKAFDNTNYVAARLSMVADLTPDLENYTIFSWSRSDTNGDDAKLSVCNRAEADPSSPATFNPLAYLGCAQIDRAAARADDFWTVESNNPHPRELIEQWQMINTTTWKASDSLTIKNIASYSEYRESADFDLWGDNFVLPGSSINSQAATNTIRLEPGFYPWTTAQSTFTEELQFQGQSGDGRLKWQAGGYMALSDPLGWNSQLVDTFIQCSNVQALQCTPTQSGYISDANTKDYFRNYGLYAQGTYKITSKLSVTGGFRYSWDRQRDLAQAVNILIPNAAAVGVGVFQCQNIVQIHQPGTGLDGNRTFLPVTVTDPAQCNITTPLNSQRPTWLIDLEYKPIEDMMLYAKYARGYREGSITSNSIGFETVGPEKVDAYEIGAKTSFHGAVPGYLNLAGFYNDFHDQQLPVNTVPAPGFNVPSAAPNVNAGHSRMWGVEVEGSISPVHGLKLDVAYTYLNTKLLQFTPPPVPIYYARVDPTSIVGGPLPLSPKNRVSLSADYTLPLSDSIGQISFGGTFVHTDANQAESPIFINGVNFQPLYLIPATNILNLNAEWRNIMGHPVDLSFFMTNVTNVGYITFPSSSYSTIGSDSGHLNQPRMFGFSLKYRFGQN